MFSRAGQSGARLLGAQCLIDGGAGRGAGDVFLLFFSYVSSGKLKWSSVKVTNSGDLPLHHITSIFKDFFLRR